MKIPHFIACINDKFGLRTGPPSLGKRGFDRDADRDLDPRCTRVRGPSDGRCSSSCPPSSSSSLRKAGKCTLLPSGSASKVRTYSWSNLCALSDSRNCNTVVNERICNVGFGQEYGICIQRLRENI